MRRYNITADVNTVAEDHGLITGRIRIKEADNGEWVRYEDAQSANRWAELDIGELIDTLGVHPLFWNGVWQACLDETNVPVEHFKSEQDCRAWCKEKNKDVIDTPTMIIEKLREKIAKFIHLEENPAFIRHSDELIGPGCHEIPLTTKIEELQAALEGLHFHHKKFEPLCRKCQATIPQETSDE